MGKKSVSFRIKLIGFAGWFLLLGCSGLVSCGYTFQTARNSLADEGLRNLFIRPLANTTLQPGAEATVYRSLIQAILARGRWKLVETEALADAILEGTVSTASYGVANLQQIQNLQPSLGRYFSTGVANIPALAVAQSYSATLGCSLKVLRVRQVPGKKVLVWSDQFSRSKIFPAANQLDVPGTTAPLIHQSEFERAISDLSVLIASDAEESMFSRF